MSVDAFTVERFDPSHLAGLRPRAEQPELMIADRVVHGRSLCATGRAFTGMRAGTPLFCAGAVATHAHYATLWAAVGTDIEPGDWIAINRRVRRFIAMLPERRVDMLVRASFEVAQRWAYWMGFAREAELRDYFEDGGDAVVFRLKRPR